MNFPPQDSPQARARQEGFTRTELAVVLATVGLLGLTAVGAMAHSRPQSYLLYCTSNMRQVGLAVHMYTKDNNDRLPPKQDSHVDFDFNSPYAPDNPLKLLRPYVGARSPRDKPSVYACPGAKPYPDLSYAPTPYTDSNLMISQLILTKGIHWTRKPAAIVLMQEFLYRGAFTLCAPELISRNSDTYSLWHCWTDSRNFMWIGPPGREYFNSVHDLGGNLLYVDGHVAYKRYADLNSLDFGLVDSSSKGVAYEPSEAQSRGSFWPEE